VPSSQVVGPQSVPAGYIAQSSPPASQLPFSPQLSAPSSAHAIAQQIRPGAVLFWRQLPLRQSSFEVHAAPFGARGAEPPAPPVFALELLEPSSSS
jgi:hypothetical protein